MNSVIITDYILRFGGQQTHTVTHLYIQNCVTAKQQSKLQTQGKKLYTHATVLSPTCSVHAQPCRRRMFFHGLSLSRVNRFNLYRTCWQQPPGPTYTWWTNRGASQVDRPSGITAGSLHRLSPSSFSFRDVMSLPPTTVGSVRESRAPVQQLASCYRGTLWGRACQHDIAKSKKMGFSRVACWPYVQSFT